MLNLASLKTPGVYIDEVPKFPPSVAAVETAIPAFIGYTEMARQDADGDLIGKARRISSFAEYVELYGNAPKQAVTVSVKAEGEPKVYTPESVQFSPSPYKMYHALRLFYANGGGPCYIVSVSTYDDGKVDEKKLGEDTGKGGLDIIRKVDEVTLLLFPDAAQIAATAPGADADAVNAAKTAYYGLFNKALKQSGELMDRFALIDVLNGSLLTEPAAFRNASLDTASLKYGAAYYPWLKTNYNYRTPDDLITLSFPDDTFTPVDDNADRDTITLASALTAHPGIATNAFAAKVHALIAREKVIMPPSPAIAGIYAATDNSRGVWKAPANMTVADVIEPTVKISEEDQRDLNVHDTGKSINAIRFFTGKGILVWGARTLAGNDNEWRYVPVRRFFNMVEESTKKATEQFVFEPNDANTWVKVQAMIENFLNTLWRVGALQGSKPDHAYYVAVGLGKTMTPLDILEGRMIVEIGMAVVRPAEFIVLRFSHKLAES